MSTRRASELKVGDEIAGPNGPLPIVDVATLGEGKFVAYVWNKDDGTLAIQAVRSHHEVEVAERVFTAEQVGNILDLVSGLVDQDGKVNIRGWRAMHRL